MKVAPFVGILELHRTVIKDSKALLPTEMTSSSKIFISVAKLSEGFGRLSLDREAAIFEHS